MRPKKPPRLYLRSNGYYVILDGNKEYATGATDPAVAQAALQKYMTTELGPVLDHYEKVTGTKHARWMVVSLKKWWATKKPDDVTPEMVETYVRFRAREVKLSTIRHELKALYKAHKVGQGVFKYGDLKAGWLPPQPPTRENYFLTRSEVAARIRWARRSPYHKHIIRALLIGVYSGTRPEAMSGLRWTPSLDGWFDLEAGILYRGQETSKTKKRGKARIHQRLLAHLKRWKRMDEARKIEFCISWRGTQAKDIHKGWRTVAKKVGQGPDGPHICKHTCITWLMQSGVTPVEVSGFVSTSIPTIEKHYLHHHPDFQINAAKARGR